MQRAFGPVSRWGWALERSLAKRARWKSNVRCKRNLHRIGIPGKRWRLGSGRCLKYLPVSTFEEQNCLEGKSERFLELFERRNPRVENNATVRVIFIIRSLFPSKFLLASHWTIYSRKEISKGISLALAKWGAMWRKKGTERRERGPGRGGLRSQNSVSLWLCKSSLFRTLRRVIP